MAYEPRTVTVVPSGDMARNHFYDRNEIVKLHYYGSATSSHSYTTRWSYTVPSNKKYYNSTLMMGATTKIATAGRYTSQVIEADLDGGGYKVIGFNQFFSTTDLMMNETLTAIFYMAEADIILGKTFHNDTTNHGQYVSIMGLEFDE